MFLRVGSVSSQLETRGEKKIIEKRVRMGKEQLESLLFRLFERQVLYRPLVRMALQHGSKEMPLHHPALLCRTSGTSSTWSQRQTSLLRG